MKKIRKKMCLHVLCHVTLIFVSPMILKKNKSQLKRLCSMLGFQSDAVHILGLVLAHVISKLTLLGLEFGLICHGLGLL